MSPIEMNSYITALRMSGADGVFWWAYRSEGTKADDEAGSMNEALKLKHWNHPHRYSNYNGDWAEVLRQFEWAA